MRKPFFKKSHNCWYVHHQGRVVRLSADKTDAFQRYHELLAGSAPTASSETVASLLNTYLAWGEKNRSPDTYTWYRHFLSCFARSVGQRLRIANLKPFHVTNWLDNPLWNQTTKGDAVRGIKRVFNWAVKQGYLSHSPLQNVERPAAKRREVFVTPEQFQLILGVVADQCFVDYLTFLHETGARPQEIKLIEARHYDLADRRIMLPPSQAKGKQFPRLIYYTETLAPMMKRLCQEQPAGPLFRDTKDNPWTRNSVNCRMRRIRVKLEEQGNPMPGLCATAFRHGFATQALKSGVDPVTVSILMGHSDTTQVARTYQHLAADPVFLTDALHKVRPYEEKSR